jgi:hypothetical protein
MEPAIATFTTAARQINDVYQRWMSSLKTFHGVINTWENNLAV